MKRIILTALVICMTAAAYAADSLIVRRAVYFDVDKYEITASAKHQLDSMISSLRDQGECAVSIYGSTDIDGSADYNKQLSERRAHAVQDYLIAQNIKAVKCVSQGLGRKGDQNSKAENRKVDVELRFTYFSSVSDLFQSLSQGSDQQYEIDPAQPNEIKCRNNTLITIPAGSLVLANGEKPNGKVTVTVREAINNADILAQDLNSISDDKMLETRGMVYISASSSGKELKVDPANPIDVSIPSANATEKDMKLFYGARHGSQQIMNWQLAESRRFLPDVKTTPVDLNRSMLDSMYITGISRPALPKASSEPVKPIEPAAPREPSAVKEPQRGNLYKASGLERTFSKRKIAKRNEILYQQAYHNYERYLDRKTRYEARLKDYQQAMIVYNEQEAIFEAEGQRRLNTARGYFRELYAYTAQGAINSHIKTLKAVQVTNKTVFNNAYVGQYQQTYPTDQHDQLRKILGDSYYRYFRFDRDNSQIADIDNEIITKKDLTDGAPVFRVTGYNVVYDSLLRATHLYDTLAMLQDRLLTRCAELGLLSQKNVAGYVASVNQLGWINCDRFYDTPKDQLVKMSIQEKDEVKMFMVFSDIKSCLPIGRSGNQYISSLIPKGKNVRIIAVKVVDGKPQLAVSPVNTSAKGPLVLEYKTCSLTDIRTSFAAM